MDTLGYREEQPDRATVDALPGATLLNFGTNWCGYCRAARRHIESALAEYPGVRVIKVEDGKGRPLGRSYGVTLWPSLVFLRDGVEVERIVRPENDVQIAAALHKITES